VDDKQRHQRLRLLIKKLNKDRKKQNQKIDILCNDLISAQRNFIKRLGIINFMVNFYESILGMTDLNKLLYTTVEFIKAENEDVNITFFLRQSTGHLPVESGTQESFELHTFENDQPITIEKQYIENCFTQELMENISRSNKVCTLDDMYAMGLHGNLNELNKISAVTIPMGLLGSPILSSMSRASRPQIAGKMPATQFKMGTLGLPLGFMLVYRSSENKLTCDEISRISAVTSGLSRAIISCRTLSHAEN
jgi:hypothetical protein